MTGNDGAEREGGERRERRDPRRAERVGVEPELLARQGVERDVVAVHDRGHERARRLGRDALGAVDHLELFAFLVRERPQLLLFDAQLVLVELALRADRRSTRPTPSSTRRRPRRRSRPATRCCCSSCRRRCPSRGRSSTPGRRSSRTPSPAARRRPRRGGDPRNGRSGRPRGCPASRRSCGRAAASCAAIASVASASSR